MRCCVLTYDIPHRKTYDTLCLLKARGYCDVSVIGLPMTYVKTFQPLIEHRPKVVADISPDTLCKNLGYMYYSSFEEAKMEENSKVLVCGAGIIPQEYVNRYRLINAHPGFIPRVRGLDSLKWAIFYDEPIGVSTHQIGDEVDAGLLIERSLVPVYVNDTFHALAQRQYEMEIVMLVDAVEKIEKSYERVLSDSFPLHKRMPHNSERELLERFEKYKEKHSS